MIDFTIKPIKPQRVSLQVWMHALKDTTASIFVSTTATRTAASVTQAMS